MNLRSLWNWVTGRKTPQQYCPSASECHQAVLQAVAQLNQRTDELEAALAVFDEKSEVLQNAICSDNIACPFCGGSGSVDSGGFTPWGAPISVACVCATKENR